MCARKSRVKNYEVKIKMKENALLTDQKSRRLPVQMPNGVDAVITKLLRDDRFEKLGKIQNDMFIQPTALTVENGKSVIIAFDAQALDEPVAKVKHLCVCTSTAT